MKMEFAGKIFDSEKPKQTNFDKIKAMTVEKMTEFLLQMCMRCPMDAVCTDTKDSCTNNLSKWLESEVTE